MLFYWALPAVVRLGSTSVKGLFLYDSLMYKNCCLLQVDSPKTILPVFCHIVPTTCSMTNAPSKPSCSGVGATSLLCDLHKQLHCMYDAFLPFHYILFPSECAKSVLKSFDFHSGCILPFICPKIS